MVVKLAFVSLIHFYSEYSFCFAFKIPDDRAVTTDYVLELKFISLFYHFVIESEELIQEVNAV